MWKNILSKVCSFVFSERMFILEGKHTLHNYAIKNSYFSFAKKVFISSICWWLKCAKYYLIDFDDELYKLVQKMECRDRDTAPVEVLRVFKRSSAGWGNKVLCWNTNNLSSSGSAARPKGGLTWRCETLVAVDRPFIYFLPQRYIQKPLQSIHNHQVWIETWSKATFYDAWWFCKNVNGAL